LPDSSEFTYYQDMSKSVSAADASRRFSELLRAVRRGDSVVVTSHGKPVAKISPVTEDERAADQARSTLLARLRKQRPIDIGRWTREELYDETK
jgi:prevent-host-death family protein